MACAAKGRATDALAWARGSERASGCFALTLSFLGLSTNGARLSRNSASNTTIETVE